VFVELRLSMSNNYDNSSAFSANSAAIQGLGWDNPDRQIAFAAWIHAQTGTYGLHLNSLSHASADASFRRYFRISSSSASFIVMDAPPEKENCRPFVDIAALLQTAGVRVPRILNWDEAQGFMLLEDLGQQTMMQHLHSAPNTKPLAMFEQAINTLLLIQTVKPPAWLGAYDEPLLRRELGLFEDWYVQSHLNIHLTASQQQQLYAVYDVLVKCNLAAPSVFVHRDFMPRNLMVSDDHGQPVLGVLDFQDAVHGPITYDIASLMRDAFISWDEDFCLDITVRYWHKARAAGLLDFEDWHSDFGSFYRAVEWMGLQRHLKVAGIFARLTLRDNKPKYLADTPRFIQYIRTTAARYRELFPLLRLLDELQGVTPASAYSFGRL